MIQLYLFIIYVVGLLNGKLPQGPSGGVRQITGQSTPAAHAHLRHVYAHRQIYNPYHLFTGSAAATIRKLENFNHFVGASVLKHQSHRPQCNFRNNIQIVKMS